MARFKRGDIVECNDGNFSIVEKTRFGHLGEWTTLNPVIGKVLAWPTKKLRRAAWSFHGPL